MPPSLSFLSSRWAAVAGVPRELLRRDVLALSLSAGLHLAALGIMAWTEEWAPHKVAFLLSWGLLNCFWLALLRRPATAAALSLAFVVVLVTVSYFKHKVIWTTANFVDLMVVD